MMSSCYSEPATSPVRSTSRAQAEPAEPHEHALLGCWCLHGAHGSLLTGSAWAQRLSLHLQPRPDTAARSGHKVPSSMDQLPVPVATTGLQAPDAGLLRL